jgi:hypothetical protein
VEEVYIHCNLEQFMAVSGAPGGTGGSAAGPADLESVPLADDDAVNGDARAKKAFLDSATVLDQEIEDMFFLGDSWGLLASENREWGPERRGLL